MTSLPLRVRLVVLCAVVAAAVSVFAVNAYLGHQGLGPSVVLVTMGAGIFISWRWPMVLYRDSISQSHQLDEGFFVVLALVSGPMGLIATFGIAAAASQIALRRSPLKAVFNVATVLIAAGLGVFVIHAVAPPSGSLTWENVAAAALGAIVYALANALGITAVLAALGLVRIRVVLDSLRVQTSLVVTAILLGCVAALGVSGYHWSGVLLLVPFIFFRQILAASFQARYDHARLRGVFQATLEVQRSMGEGAVTATLCAAARRLLRSEEAGVVDELPEPGSMYSPLSIGGVTRWLVVSGRSRTEPFDDADQGLLDALAVAGAAELENASLYEERRRQQERIEAITASLGEGVCAFDAAGRVSFVNPAARVLLGLGEGTAFDPLARPELAGVAEPALRVIASGTTISSEREYFVRADGTRLPVEYTCSAIRSGEQVQGAVVTFRDISERLAFEEQLEFHAFRDALTGLPNRRVFLDRLEHALQRAGRSGEVLAVFFADIDRFKVVNDSLGHAAGDQLLVAIAQRLGALTRAEDTLARFGGDEFTLLIEGVPELAAAEELARRMNEGVHEPIELEAGRTVVASVSVGVALAAAGSTADDVLHNADVAMYQSKRRRAGQYAVFDVEAMASRSAERVDLETALRRAIANRGLSVYFQPLVATGSGDIVGAEALVRWMHPERGLLHPGDFIGLAEETGLVLELGEFVLEEACRHARHWQDTSEEDFSVSVNLSAQQFQDAALVEKVADALLDNGLQARHLCLEITESLALQDIDRSIATLTELKALGVQMAIDDFGTGYSSLTYLKRFPVDVVKLDRTFVQDLAISSVDAAIVVAVVDLARNLGLVAVAEGVENPEQLARLAAMGCPVLQGFLLAHPMPADDFRELLRERPRLPVPA